MTLGFRRRAYAVAGVPAWDTPGGVVDVDLAQG